MAQDLAGKVALITGGASGIGRETARLFVANGAAVMVADYNVDGAQAVAEEVGGAAVRVDVADSASVQAMVAATKERFGGIDILVNSAGVGTSVGHIHVTPDDIFDRVVAINLRGTFLCMKYSIPSMIERGGGRIINLASIAGITGLPSGVAYSASKAGVIGMTRVAAKEYARANILVNAICPGWTDTPMVEEAVKSRGERFEQAIQAGIPLGRYGTPQEIAAACLFLATGASFMTGAPLILDGGITA